MMGAERQQQDDRDRNSDQPKQDGAHNNRLLLARSGGNNGPETQRFRLLDDSCRSGFFLVLASAEHCSAEHDRCGIEHDHENQPAKDF